MAQTSGLTSLLLDYWPYITTGIGAVWIWIREKQIVKFKSKLSSQEYTSRESAKVFVESFRKLEALQKDVQSYVKQIEFRNEPSRKEKLRQIDTNNEAFQEVFFQNLVLLPTTVAEPMSKLYHKLIKIIDRFNRHNNPHHPSQPTAWGEASDSYSEIASPMFDEVLARGRVFLQVNILDEKVGPYSPELQALMDKLDKE